MDSYDADVPMNLCKRSNEEEVSEMPVVMEEIKSEVGVTGGEFLGIKQEPIQVMDEVLNRIYSIKIEQPTCDAEGHFRISIEQVNIKEEPYEIEGWPGEVKPDTTVHEHAEEGQVEPGGSFPRTITDRRHVLHGKPLLECSYCDKVFLRSFALKQHILRHTGERPYKCSDCAKTFACSTSLTRHARFHTGERPFVCDVCQRSFAHNSSLTQHKRTHTGERPYSCDICGQSYAKATNLTQHKSVHTGERPYKCDICDKTFVLPSGLRTHKKIHTGLRPYACEMCDKAFGRKYTLDQHVKAHLGERPFKCDVCQSTFVSMYNLKRHQKHRHTIQIVNNISSESIVSTTVPDNIL